MGWDRRGCIVEELGSIVQVQYSSAQGSCPDGCLSCSTQYVSMANVCSRVKQSAEDSMFGQQVPAGKVGRRRNMRLDAR
eukprot:828035-Pelagomonas_calceolata.AAC.8